MQKESSLEGIVLGHDSVSFLSASPTNSAQVMRRLLAPYLSLGIAEPPKMGAAPWGDLDYRAWTLQKQYLSPRTLTYTDGELLGLRNIQRFGIIAYWLTDPIRFRLQIFRHKTIQVVDKSGSS
jgi:hypothetical protein